MLNKAGYGIKKDYQLEKWEISEMPILCKKCFSDESYVRMLKSYLSKECKICNKPFTTFSFKIKNIFKKTEICQLCSKVNNSCQSCLNDLNLGISINIRNKLMKENKIKLLNSEGNKEYYNNLLQINSHLWNDEDIKNNFDICKNNNLDIKSNNIEYLEGKNFSNKYPILMVYYVLDNMVNPLLDLLNNFGKIIEYKKLKNYFYIVFDEIESLNLFYKSKFSSLIIKNKKLNISYVKQTINSSNLSFSYLDKYYLPISIKAKPVKPIFKIEKELLQNKTSNLKLKEIN